MRPLILDTNAYTAFKKGDPHITSILQTVEEIILSPIVLGELLAGFQGGQYLAKNKKELDLFLDSARVQVHPITSDTAHFYGLIFNRLKSKGSPIPSNDMWIAAQALEKGYQICTLDKHFLHVEGIVIIQTLTDLI